MGKSSMNFGLGMKSALVPQVERCLKIVKRLQGSKHVYMEIPECQDYILTTALYTTDL